MDHPTQRLPFRLDQFGEHTSVAASELVTLYESDRRGSSSPIPLPPIQYADFARWQRDQFESGAWQSQIDRWRNRLSGVPPLELPTDRPRPPIRSARGALHPLVLSPDLSQAVRALGRREECTPFMILLAAFQLLLSRWSGQDDFADRLACRQPDSRGDREIDRILREHGRTPRRPLRESDHA